MAIFHGGPCVVFGLCSLWKEFPPRSEQAQLMPALIRIGRLARVPPFFGPFGMLELTELTDLVRPTTLLVYRIPECINVAVVHSDARRPTRRLRAASPAGH